MTEQELQFVLSEGEGLFVEFKERPDKSLAREMTAFANASGGRIFIGVSDDSQPIGIQSDNRLKSQIQDVARNCDPPVEIKLASTDRILVVDIPESPNKPHACSDGFFMRIGANSQKLSRDEIFSMGICSGRLRFDEQICGAFDCSSDIDEEKVSAYLRAAGLNATLPLTEILANLEVLNSANGKPVMTNAGVLLFAKNPQRFLKSSPVVCALYQGDDKVQILDRKIFNDGLIGNIDAAVTYLKRHMDVRFEIRSVRREEISQAGYPLNASSYNM
jgi:ATP-dependent DNA helicase RecG